MTTTSQCAALRRASASLIAVLAVLTTACSPVLQAQLRRSSASAPRTTATERQIIRSVNQFRAVHGRPALQVTAVLEHKARAWSAWMAAGRCGRNAQGIPTICHSNLPTGINVHWSRLEENVGEASPRTAVTAITTGFQHSPEHAANMLNAQITDVGVGVAYFGDFVFVTEEFMAP
jgi:uncharacterized protein YkwD